MLRSGNQLERRRLAGTERRAQIVSESANLFAELGFGVSTRAIADHLGVTQALLYRYFASKQEIVDAVFETIFLDRWNPALNEPLADRSVLLAERLTTFYQTFARRFSDRNMRLFVRAALDGMHFPDRYASALDQRVLEPVVAELRHEAELPDLSTRPITLGERELALMLHGSIVFLGIRRHVYRMPLPDDISRHVAMHVTTFLPGAVEEIRRLQKLTRRNPFARPPTRSSARPVSL